MISFGIKDVIDILLVAFLLYYIYRLMKRSSAANIFTGIIIFILVWIVVSQIFSMRLLGTILDKLVSMGALALVVLFQEEIRRFFSSIGTRSSRLSFPGLFRSRRHDPHREEYLPVVMACKNMSRDKVGALIVLEQNVGLSEYIGSGDLINADISQRLNSPLHDGAVIIRGGRIAAAGCILPVSHNADIPKSLGLRHRAALGISQKTDAVSIIVSEETGSISVARGGQFRLAITADELENFLNNPDLLE